MPTNLENINTNTNNKYIITYKEIFAFTIFVVVIYFIFKKSKDDKYTDNATTKKVQDAFNPNAYKDIFNKSKYKKLQDYLDEKGLTKDDIQKILENIYNAKGTINDDEDIIYSIFRSLPSVFIISVISNLFENQYKTNLKLYLSSFLDNKELDIVHQIINDKKYI